jgi:hypothetical protein
MAAARRYLSGALCVRWRKGCHLDNAKGLAMTISATDCMAKALELDAKAASSTYEPDKALYRLLAKEWRTSHDRAIWQDPIPLVLAISTLRLLVPAEPIGRIP